jgi:hypothetical protein
VSNRSHRTAARLQHQQITNTTKLTRQGSSPSLFSCLPLAHAKEWRLGNNHRSKVICAQSSLREDKAETSRGLLNMQQTISRKYQLLFTRLSLSKIRPWTHRCSPSQQCQLRCATVISIFRDSFFRALTILDRSSPAHVSALRAVFRVGTPVAMDISHFLTHGVINMSQPKQFMILRPAYRGACS